MNKLEPRSALLIFLGLVAGACLVCQQAMNARLRTSIGSYYGAGFFSYAGGTLAMMLVLALMREPLPSIAEMSNTPWWAWTGGAFGAVYIVAAVVLVPRLGATLTVSCIVLGQMLMSLVFDQAGALGIPQHTTTPIRVIGVGLVILGTLLVRR